MNCLDKYGQQKKNIPNILDLAVINNNKVYSDISSLTSRRLSSPRAKNTGVFEFYNQDLWHLFLQLQL